MMPDTAHSSQTQDLLALVLTLEALAPSPAQQAQPSADAAPNRWWGRAAHALLLHTVDTLNPDLARTLHDGDGMRPFACSTLQGRLPGGRALPGERYTLRLSVMGAELAALLASSTAAGGVLSVGAVVELDYQPFRIVAVATDRAAHPRAGTDSFTALAARQAFQAEPERKLRLNLLSPTGFRVQGRHQPLPLPELVFGSLLERWNTFAPLTFAPEARRYAAECLTMSRFEIATRVVPAKENAMRVGCVGSVEYSALVYDRYWLGVMHTLAAFAFYSGVGAAVSFGLGQAG